MRSNLLLICLLLCSICLNAQWYTVYNGQGTFGSIYKHVGFYNDSSGLVVGWDWDALITHDQGNTWEQHWGMGEQQDFDFIEGGEAVIMNYQGGFEKLNIFTFEHEYLFQPQEDYEMQTMILINDTMALTGGRYGIFRVDIKDGYDTTGNGISSYINSICKISESVFYAFAGYSTSNNTLLKSTDAGLNWYTVLNDVGMTGTLYCKNEDTFFIASWDGIYRSINAGFDWQKMNCFPDTAHMNFRDITFTDEVNGYAVGGGTIFPEIKPSSIYKTTDGGENWYRQYFAEHGGLYSVCFTSDSIGFTCGEDLIILKTVNGGGIGVGTSNLLMDKIPYQVYPNPFTTSTTIDFTLNGRSNIRISIFNSRGEEVYRVEEHTMPAGHHTLTPSIHHLPTGLYYMTIRTGEGVSVLKMIKQ